MFFTKPDPGTASRQAIFTWLVVADISQEPLPWQVALVERLEAELQSGLDGLALDGPTGSLLTDAQHARLSGNISALKRVWFVHSVREYSSLPAASRPSYLDNRIETVLAWSALEGALSRDEGARKSSESRDGASVAAFFDQIEAWIENERDPRLQSQMTAAVHDGVVRWLTTHSLAEQPMSVRTQLALRIAHQLDRGLDVSEVAAAGNEGNNHLRENSELLLEAWMLHQARRYSEISPQEKPKFIARQINHVAEWDVFSLVAGDAQQQRPGQGAVRLLRLTEEWIARAPEAERTKLRQLVADVQSQLLSRMLKNGFSF